MKPTKDEIIRKMITAILYEHVADWILSLWPEEPKAIGWDEYARRANFTHEDTAFGTWQDAQAALVDSGEVIQVPKEWPHRAMRMTIGWIDEDGKITRYHGAHFIARPQPAWKPKEGEWVWKWISDGYFIADKYDKDDHDVTMYAEIQDFEREKSWTFDKFRQRGRFWEEK